MGCETLTSGIIDVYHDLGLDPTGQVDGYDVLMASIRGLTGSAKYVFPAGKFLISRPILTGPYGPEFHGAGIRLTSLDSPYNYFGPVLIFGVCEVDGTNQITAAYRPDAFGKLDSSLVTGPGTWRGFRTNADTIGLAPHGALSLGTYTDGHGGAPWNADSRWSYWSEEATWTFEAAITFDGGFPTTVKPLFGFGLQSSSLPSPWVIGTNDAGQFMFNFRTNDNTAYLFYFDPPAVTPTSVLRVRVWIDFDAGTLGAAINGVDRPLTYPSALPIPSLVGKRFLRCSTEYPFTIGRDAYVQAVPDFTVWAMRTSAVAIKTEPANDHARYTLDGVGNTTICQMTGAPTLGRDLEVLYGVLGHGNVYGCILLLPSMKATWISGGGLFDMTINGGSPIWIANVLQPFAIERVNVGAWIVGIASIPTISPSYNLSLRDVTSQGSDASVSFYNTLLWADGLTSMGAGITNFRFIGCNVFLKNAFAAYFNNRAESAMDVLYGQYGGIVTIDNFMIDNELNAFSRAIIQIDQSANVGSMLVDIRRLQVSSATGIPIVKLTGHVADGGAWRDGLFFGAQWWISASDYSATLDVGDGWVGTLDVRNMIGAGPDVIGSGAGNITVVGTSEPGGPPPDPTKTTGIIDVVYDLGLDPAGTVDGYDALMTSIRGLTGPTRYEFPPGDFKFSRPIIAGHLSPEFHGAGRSLTSIGPTGYMKFPTFVFGIREVDGTKQVTAANRPDAYGKLDSSWVGSSGIKTGFRTLGTIWGVAHHHPLALGSMSPQGDNLWTYHSEEAAWTFETAMTFDGGFPSNAHLFGTGVGDERNPAPWQLGTTIDGQFQFFFRTNDDTLYLCYITPPTVTATSVLKLRIWIDWIAGTIGFAINGLAATVTWPWTGVTPDLTGKRFWRNKGVYPFTIGTDKYRRSLPDFTIWGMRVSTIAIKTEPANDVGRYGMDNVNNTTATFMPGDGPPGRDLRMDWGMAYPNGGQGRILLLDREGSYGLGGGGVFDMTINYGSPAILMGQVLTPFRLERLICSGGAVGIGSLPPLSPSYSIVMHEVSVSGSDCGMSLYNTEINAVRLDCPGGGLHSFRAQGGGLMLQHSLIANFHPRAETALEVYGSEWGATVSIDDFLVDNESTTFSDAVIRIAQGAYTGPAMVNIRQVGIGLTSAVPLVILTGNAPVSNDPSRWQMGLFYMSHFSIYSNNYSAALDVGEGWYGTADVRSLGIQTVTGIGARNIRVIGNIKTSGVVDAVEDLGLDPTGTLDGYDILMASIRGLTGPAQYHFPQGTFLFTRPILTNACSIVSIPPPEFHGAGRQLTTLTSGYNNHKPIFIFGLREISGTNQVTTAHRPDAYGFLDYTLAGGPGGWHGFRTMGDTYGIVQSQPLALGGLSPLYPGQVQYSYWSEEVAWTLETALTFNGGFPDGKTLFGFGYADAGQFRPWVLNPSGGLFRFYWLTNDGSGYGFSFPAPTVTPTSVLRLRIWIDFNAGTCGAAIDGVDQTLTWIASGNFTGKRFQRNCGEHPFYIGTDEGNYVPPDFTVWALRISNAAHKVEPANDVGRYWEDYAGRSTIAYTSGTGPPGRDLDTRIGLAGHGSQASCIFLLPSRGYQGPYPGGGVYDMTIENGTPCILLLMFLSPFAIERVTCTSPFVGIASIPTIGPSYTMRMTGVSVSGADCGMALWHCEVQADGLECARGGITTFRFFGGVTIIRNMLVGFFGPHPETVFEFYLGQWGATICLENCNIDNEGGVYFGAAAIRIAQSIYVGSQLIDLKRISVSETLGIPIVQLNGHPPDSNWQVGLFKAEQFTFYSNTYTSIVDINAPWVWGTLDVRNLGGTPVTGAGAGNIEVVGVTTQATSIEDQSEAEPGSVPPRLYPEGTRRYPRPPAELPDHDVSLSLAPPKTDDGTP